MEIVTANSDNKSRILYLSGDVGAASISDISKQLLDIIEFDTQMGEKLKKYEMQPIHLYIQSFGGSVYDMWTLIDIIRSSTTPIITYCSGYCMSAAALIFLAGHVRIMYKHSCIMFHQLCYGNVDKIKDFVLETHQAEQMHKEIIQYIKKSTKLGKKFFKRFDSKKEDIYLTAKECLKYGVCDDVVKNSHMREYIIQQVAESDMEG